MFKTENGSKSMFVNNLQQPRKSIVLNRFMIYPLLLAATLITSGSCSVIVKNKLNESHIDGWRNERGEKDPQHLVSGEKIMVLLKGFGTTGEKVNIELQPEDEETNVWSTDVTLEDEGAVKFLIPTGLPSGKYKIKVANDFGSDEIRVSLMRYIFGISPESGISAWPILNGEVMEPIELPNPCQDPEKIMDLRVHSSGRWALGTCGQTQFCATGCELAALHIPTLEWTYLSTPKVSSLEMPCFAEGGDLTGYSTCDDSGSSTLCKLNTDVGAGGPSLTFEPVIEAFSVPTGFELLDGFCGITQNGEHLLLEVDPVATLGKSLAIVRIPELNEPRIVQKECGGSFSGNIVVDELGIPSPIKSYTNLIILPDTDNESNPAKSRLIIVNAANACVESSASDLNYKPRKLGFSPHDDELALAWTEPHSWNTETVIEVLGITASPPPPTLWRSTQVVANMNQPLSGIWVTLGEEVGVAMWASRIANFSETILVSTVKENGTYSISEPERHVFQEPVKGVAVEPSRRNLLFVATKDGVVMHDLDRGAELSEHLSGSKGREYTGVAVQP